jgi:hypothetical protein
MKAANVKGVAADIVFRFFEDIVDHIDQVHIDGPKPWTEDAMVTYTAWQWDLIRDTVAELPLPKVFVIVGLAEVWDYPEPYGYSGMGDPVVDPTDIPGTLRLRLAFAADKVARQLFNSGGIKDKEDRR